MSALPESPGVAISASLAKGIGAESVSCRLTKGDCFLGAFRDVLLDEDLVLNCSGLLGSRSFVFVAVCRHCITFLDRRPSPVLVLVPVDADRACDRIFGAGLGFDLG